MKEGRAQGLMAAVCGAEQHPPAALRFFSTQTQKLQPALLPASPPITGMNNRTIACMHTHYGCACKVVEEQDVVLPGGCKSPCNHCQVLGTPCRGAACRAACMHAGAAVPLGPAIAAAAVCISILLFPLAPPAALPVPCLLLLLLLPLPAQAPPNNLCEVGPSLLILAPQLAQAPRHVGQCLGCACRPLQHRPTISLDGPQHCLHAALPRPVAQLAPGP